MRCHRRARPGRHTAVDRIPQWRWPDDQYGIGSKETFSSSFFPQGGGRTSVHVPRERAGGTVGWTCGTAALPQAFAGLRSIPDALGLGDVTAAGPCARSLCRGSAGTVLARQAPKSGSVQARWQPGRTRPRGHMPAQVQARVGADSSQARRRESAGTPWRQLPITHGIGRSRGDQAAGERRFAVKVMPGRRLEVTVRRRPWAGVIHAETGRGGSRDRAPECRANTAGL